MGQYTLLNQDIDTSFLTLEMTWRVIRDPRFFKQLGRVAQDPFQEVIRGTTINTYMDAQEMKRICSVCAQQLFSRPALLKSLLTKTRIVIKKMDQVARSNITATDDATYTQLAKILYKILALQVECTVYGAAAAFADVYGEVSDTLVSVVSKRKHLKHPIHFYTTTIGTPKNLSLTQRAYKDIQQQDAGEIDSLLKKYFWLDQGYIGRGLTRSGLQEIRNRSHEETKSTMVVSKLLRELKLTPKEQWAFSVSRGVIELKSYRADARQKLHVVINRIVDRLAKEWDVEARFLETMYIEEFLRALNDRSTLPADLVQRWEHSVYVSKDVEYSVILKEDAVKKFLNSQVAIKNLDKKKEIRGMVAQPGCVRGRVALVFGPQHNAKVHEGDILVSTATSPQLLPAMKRAAAFITDVGGVTSHAAIVAREMNKPCIVGTRVATQVLQDGDRVEVDATRGVIKKI